MTDNAVCACLVSLNTPRLYALCVKYFVTRTWSFSILSEYLLPPNIHNDLVYGWSWRWLMICHAFFNRLEKSTDRYEDGKILSRVLRQRRKKIRPPLYAYPWVDNAYHPYVYVQGSDWGGSLVQEYMEYMMTM